MEICINNTSYDSPPDAIVATIAHELGHLYGLHEQYNDEVKPPICNPKNVSIMDRLVPFGGEHCDGPIRGPQDIDETHVYEFHRDGYLTNWTSTKNGNEGIVEWQDEAWGERHHVIEHLYSMDGGNSYRAYKTKELLSVGNHTRIDESQWIQRTLDLTQHFRDFAGVHIVDTTYYRMCGAAYFAQMGTSGPSYCSPPIAVSNTDHNNSLLTPTPTLSLIHISEPTRPY